MNNEKRRRAWKDKALRFLRQGMTLGDALIPTAAV